MRSAHERTAADDNVKENAVICGGPLLTPTHEDASMGNMQTLFAIYDTTADDMLGGPFCITRFRTNEQAIRFFNDNYQSPNSPITAHPEDYELRALGYIGDNGAIDPLIGGPSVILTGRALVAMLNNQQEQLRKEA